VEYKAIRGDGRKRESKVVVGCRPFLLILDVSRHMLGRTTIPFTRNKWGGLRSRDPQKKPNNRSTTESTVTAPKSFQLFRDGESMIIIF